MQTGKEVLQDVVCCTGPCAARSEHQLSCSAPGCPAGCNSFSLKVIEGVCLCPASGGVGMDGEDSGTELRERKSDQEKRKERSRMTAPCTSLRALTVPVHKAASVHLATLNCSITATTSQLLTYVLSSDIKLSCVIFRVQMHCLQEKCLLKINSK